MGNRSSKGRILLEDPIRHHTVVSDRQHEDHVREMGRRRRENDDRAGALADTRARAEHDRTALCQQRWPGIVEAIRRLLAVYNGAAGAELLTASESDGEDRGVTIASQGSAHGTLTIAVDGDALLVRTNPGPHSAAALHGIARRRVDCSRSDTGTAAYLLQGWIDNL